MRKPAAENGDVELGQLDIRSGRGFHMDLRDGARQRTAEAEHRVPDAETEGAHADGDLDDLRAEARLRVMQRAVADATEPEALAAYAEKLVDVHANVTAVVALDVDADRVRGVFDREKVHFGTLSERGDFEETERWEPSHVTTNVLPRFINHRSEIKPLKPYQAASRTMPRPRAIDKVHDAIIRTYKFT